MTDSNQRGNAGPEISAALPVPSPRQPSHEVGERLAYSVDEAAQLTALSRDLLYTEMRREHLGYLKVGRRRLITRLHLEQFLGTTLPHPPVDAHQTGGRGR